MNWTIRVSTNLRMYDAKLKPSNTQVRTFLQRLLESRYLNAFDFTIELKEPETKEVPNGESQAV